MDRNKIILLTNYVYFFKQKICLLGYVKVSKGAKIRKRYNQVPHLTQDTNEKVRRHNESQEVSPFPAGDHIFTFGAKKSIEIIYILCSLVPSVYSQKKPWRQGTRLMNPCTLSPISVHIALAYGSRSGSISLLQYATPAGGGHFKLKNHQTAMGEKNRGYALQIIETLSTIPPWWHRLLSVLRR